jgi:hypothetical protein
MHTGKTLARCPKFQMHGRSRDWNPRSWAGSADLPTTIAP